MSVRMCVSEQLCVCQHACVCGQEEGISVAMHDSCVLSECLGIL